MSFNWYITGSGKNQKMYDFLSERIPTIGYTDNNDANLFIAAKRMYIDAYATAGSIWTRICARTLGSTSALLCLTSRWAAQMITAAAEERKRSICWSGRWTG